ncbi:hypothetical protein BDV19DRAFT_374880 [Aspergillus venezuelensis]
MTGHNESAFLLQLPVEIRLHIYKLVFGGDDDDDKVIVIKADEDLQPRQDTCSEKGEKLHRFVELRDNARTFITCMHHIRNPDETKLEGFSLLLTCRQIYSEALEILWSQCSVHLQIESGPLQFLLLSNFQSSIPPRQFSAIRQLEVSFLHPSIKRQAQVLDEEWFDGWSDFWKLVKCLKKLVRIQAWIQMYQEPGGNIMTEEQEKRLYAPLRELDWLRDFQVEVTWPANDYSKSLLVGAPFRLTRNTKITSNKLGQGRREVGRSAHSRWANAILPEARKQ